MLIGVIADDFTGASDIGHPSPRDYLVKEVSGLSSSWAFRKQTPLRMSKQGSWLSRAARPAQI